MVTTQQVSQLRTVPAEVVDDLRAELSQVKIPWREAYGDYQAGGWSTAPLLNSSGSLEQTRLDGIAPQPTALYEAMPRTRKFIEESGLEVLLVRLAKVDPKAWMHEHNDNVGLDEETLRLRLHLPIQTNPQATLSVGSEVSNENVFLKPGHMWKLDHERVPHSASNLGAEPRIHLILDCLMNEKLGAMLRAEHLDADALIELPVLDLAKENALVEHARELYKRGQNLGDQNIKREAEHMLIGLFHTFNLQGRSSYDVLLRMFEDLEGAGERRSYWLDRLKEVRSR